MKDAEKSLVGNTDTYSTFKSRLAKLPDNVIVISSHTHSDNHKDKSHPGGLLFTKFGGSQTSLLDLAFLDEALLASWKHQLDQNAETLKMKGNLNLLQTDITIAWENFCG